MNFYSNQQTEWIEKFEICIKFNQLKPKKGPAPKPPIQLQQQKSLVETKSIASDLTISPDSQSVKINWGPDWLLMAPEEVLVMIAQRHFEDSLAMIVKCEEYFTRDSTFHNAVEIIDKVMRWDETSVSNFKSFSPNFGDGVDQAIEAQSCERFVAGIIQLSES